MTDIHHNFDFEDDEATIESNLSEDQFKKGIEVLRKLFRGESDLLKNNSEKQPPNLAL